MPADPLRFPRPAGEAALPVPSPERLLLDIDDLAEMLRLSTRHLRRMDGEGDIPGRTKLGRRVLFHAESVREWVACGCPDASTWAARRKAKR